MPLWLKGLRHQLLKRLFDTLLKHFMGACITAHSLEESDDRDIFILALSHTYILLSHADISTHTYLYILTHMYFLSHLHIFTFPHIYVFFTLTYIHSNSYIYIYINSHICINILYSHIHILYILHLKSIYSHTYLVTFPYVYILETCRMHVFCLFSWTFPLKLEVTPKRGNACKILSSASACSAYSKLMLNSRTIQ